ncbi:unnamed protein product [Calypogeia fissa]
MALWSFRALQASSVLLLYRGLFASIGGLLNLSSVVCPNLYKRISRFSTGICVLPRRITTNRHSITSVYFSNRVSPVDFTAWPLRHHRLKTPMDLSLAVVRLVSMKFGYDSLSL